MDKLAQAYKWGLQRALVDAGLIKTAWMPDPLLAFLLTSGGLGAGTGALAGKLFDPKERVGKGALIGGLAGVGAGLGGLHAVSRGSEKLLDMIRRAGGPPGGAAIRHWGDELGNATNLSMLGGGLGGGALGTGVAAALPASEPEPFYSKLTGG